MKLPKKNAKPYRLGIALSGGGAKGFAHIGAIRAIHDFGLQPDLLAGVSAGSVVATFYSAGLINSEQDALLDLFNHTKFSDFAQPRVPKDGFFTIERFTKKLRELIPYQNIEELPIKTFIGATNLDAGTKVAWDSGSLAERVTASCSIPILFEPVTINGDRYVDGGVVANLPAWSIRHLCDKLIGINCSPMGNPEPAKGIVEIARRSYSLMSKNNVTADMELCDLVINLQEVANHQTFDLHDLEMLIETGYLTTIRTLRAATF